MHAQAAGACLTTALCLVLSCLGPAQDHQRHPRQPPRVVGAWQDCGRARHARQVRNGKPPPLPKQRRHAACCHDVLNWPTGSSDTRGVRPSLDTVSQSLLCVHESRGAKTAASTSTCLHAGLHGAPPCIRCAQAPGASRDLLLLDIALDSWLRTRVETSIGELGNMKGEDIMSVLELVSVHACMEGGGAAGMLGRVLLSPQAPIFKSRSLPPLAFSPGMLGRLCVDAADTPRAGAAQRAGHLAAGQRPGALRGLVGPPDR